MHFSNFIQKCSGDHYFLLFWTEIRSFFTFVLEIGFLQKHLVRQIQSVAQLLQRLSEKLHSVRELELILKQRLQHTWPRTRAIVKDISF